MAAVDGEARALGEPAPLLLGIGEGAEDPRRRVLVVVGLGEQRAQPIEAAPPESSTVRTRPRLRVRTSHFASRSWMCWPIADGPAGHAKVKRSLQ